MVTFSVASSFGVDLTVGNVFYTIALLSLQRVYISQFFVQGVSNRLQYLSAEKMCGTSLYLQHIHIHHTGIAGCG